MIVGKDFTEGKAIPALRGESGHQSQKGGNGKGARPYRNQDRVQRGLGMESHKKTTLLYHQRRRQSRIGMGKTGASPSATERRVSNRGCVSLFGRTVQACGCLCELVGRGGSGVSVQHTQQSCGRRRRKDRANKLKRYAPRLGKALYDELSLVDNSMQGIFLSTLPISRIP